MVWSACDFPPPMQRLSEGARAKAIGIGNVLLTDGLEEGRAVQIAIAIAEAWARHHGLAAYDTAPASEQAH